MKYLITVIIATLCLSNSFAQNDSLKIQSKLDEFIGEWEGDGWHYHNPKKTNYFKQKCKIIPKLDGHILIVEQHATLIDNPEIVIFKEFAIWRLSKDGQNIIVEQYRKESKLRIQNYTYKNGKLIQLINDGQIKYITQITENGEYLMSGFKTDTIGVKNKFFEMKLIKVE